MAKGYLIARIDVHDPDAYRAYVAMSSQAVEKHHGRFLIRGGASRQVEGEGRSRQAVIEFDSYEAALGYYHSPEYQAATAVRQPVSSADIVIVRGID